MPASNPTPTGLCQRAAGERLVIGVYPHRDTTPLGLIKLRHTDPRAASPVGNPGLGDEAPLGLCGTSLTTAHFKSVLSRNPERNLSIS